MISNIKTSMKHSSDVTVDESYIFQNCFPNDNVYNLRILELHVY